MPRDHHKNLNSVESGNMVTGFQVTEEGIKYFIQPLYCAGLSLNATSSNELFLDF